ALDLRLLAPVPLERLEDKLHSRLERDELVGAGADRRLLEAFRADFLDVFLRHDPARAGRRGIERQEIRPRLLQLEADMPGVRRFDRGDTSLQQIVRDAAVAIE